MGYRDNYQAWLRDFAADAQAVAELKAIEGDEKEIEDRFYRNLSFGTAGMRGVLAMGMNRMNVYTVRRATQGLSDFLSANEESRRRGVVIAYDSRRMSREFAEETALVLCANGVPVFLFDALRPVPILSYAVRHLHAAAGVVITASHNPPQYNGYITAVPSLSASTSTANTSDRSKNSLCGTSRSNSLFFSVLISRKISFYVKYHLHRTYSFWIICIFHFFHPFLYKLPFYYTRFH